LAEVQQNILRYREIENKAFEKIEYYHLNEETGGRIIKLGR